MIKLYTQFFFSKYNLGQENRTFQLNTFSLQISVLTSYTKITIIIYRVLNIFEFKFTIMD